LLFKWSVVFTLLLMYYSSVNSKHVGKKTSNGIITSRKSEDRKYNEKYCKQWTTKHYTEN